MLQKLKTIAISLLFASGLTVPLLVSTPAFAAKMQPVGTCFYNAPGSKTTKIEKCSALKLTSKQKDTSGAAVDIKKNCYEVNATTSSESIVHVNCDDTPLKTNGSGAGAVMCSIGGKNEPCEDAPVTPGGNCMDVSKCDLISKYINPFINFLSALVGVAVVMSIIVGGIQYGSSAGDSAKVTAAKNRIRNSIIALLTFLFLYALLNFLIPGGLV